MGSCLQNVVLEIPRIDEHQTLFLADLRKVPETLKIPGIELTEIIQTETVPCRALTGSSPGQFIEGGPDIPIDSPDHFMIISTTIIPQTGMMPQAYRTALGQTLPQLLQIIRQPSPLQPGGKASEIDAELIRTAGRNMPSPPSDTGLTPCSQPIAYHQPPLLVLKRKGGLGMIV